MCISVQDLHVPWINTNGVCLNFPYNTQIAHKALCSISFPWENSFLWKDVKNYRNRIKLISSSLNNKHFNIEYSL